MAIDNVSRARGCILALMCGDALGAAVEGFDSEYIRDIARENCGGRDELSDFIPAVHMATHVANTSRDVINGPPLPGPRHVP